MHFNVFDDNETSVILKSILKKMKAKKVVESVKKRIKEGNNSSTVKTTSTNVVVAFLIVMFTRKINADQVSIFQMLSICRVSYT